MAKTMKWVIGTMVAAGLAYAAWSHFKPADKVNYITEPVKRSNIRQTVSATGEISPSNLVEIGAQASGQIKKLYVKLGQEIKKGDRIADIDSTTQTNTLNTEKAKLDTYKAQLASAEIALRSASKKYKREAALWKEDATSKQELEEAENALASAKAQVAQLQSSIRQTQTSINTAEADLGHTRIIAPIDGTVVAILVEEGQTVNANQATPTIIQLANLETMLNKMQIAEGDVTKVKPGQPLSFTILSESDTPFTSQLESIDPGLTTMSKGSYNKKTDTTESAIYYYARALVSNAEGKLAIGMTTQNTIEINVAENVLAVPTITIKKDREGKSFVRVLGQNGQAVRKDITTGLKDSMNTEVKSGLDEGDKVIVSETNPSDTAQDGDRHMGPPM
ncbi:efflux RND transporter periplasmic adaptor subunit [Neisseria iguanae]|uniref:Efflux transporter periplasmic adaptor subunit n=1 Tax=Neisseria iguanae TaxID=90242 RepID=A0A2P7U2F4_9NEIS|nr:efflux RND transporter periplasmic adaptor subunit [Neisseria iguanae]PSJ81164.1 efflux transporter periplasmic adaptor subunit [Neisseria iguanae]